MVVMILKIHLLKTKFLRYLQRRGRVQAVKTHTQRSPKGWYIFSPNPTLRNALISTTIF